MHSCILKSVFLCKELLWVSINYAAIIRDINTKVRYITILHNKQCTYKVTLRRVRVTFFAVQEAIRITYSKCVSVGLGIQNAMRMG